MRHPTPRRATTRRRPAGFTLIELSIVILLIGLIIAFILTASYGGIQRAEIRATQALIAKLDSGINDRYEALLRERVDPNHAHEFLANIYTTGTPAPGYDKLGNTDPTNPGGLYSSGRGGSRSQVVARYDLIKAELPDVFALQVDPANLSGAANYPNIYPFNFCGVAFPGVSPATGTLAAYAGYVLPMGNLVLWDPLGQSGGPSYGGFLAPPVGPVPPNFNPQGTGIFGASYAAAAGLYKNLGALAPNNGSPQGVPYKPQGYDLVDNDGDGLVDEFEEGVDASNIASVTQALANHTHKTARAEMLYALLVEGRGPLGSVFNRDDFTAREVRDTDNDGLPEFVDAWGEPIQFYRWPIFFESDIQKGAGPYSGVLENRQQDPLDVDNQLVAPAWWYGGSNMGFNGDPLGGTVGSTGMSVRALTFQTMFHSLIDYNAAGGPPGAGTLWDRGGFFQRRAYFSRPLVVSSGPDRKLGLGQLDYEYGAEVNVPANPSRVPVTVANLLQIEGAAAPLAPQRSTPPYYVQASDAAGVQAAMYDWRQDDITSQTLQSGSGGNQ